MKLPVLSEYLAQTAPGTLTIGGARMAFIDIEAGFWSLRRQVENLLGARQAGEIFQQAGANGGASYAATQGLADEPQKQGELFARCLQAYQAAGFGQFEIVESTWPLGRMTVRARDAFEAWMMSRHGQRAHSPVCAYTAGVLVGFINVVSQRRDVVCIERRCQACGDEVCEFDFIPAAQAQGHQVLAVTPDPIMGMIPPLRSTLDEPQLRETLTRLTANESLLRSIVENARHFAIYRVTLDSSSPYGARVTFASPSIRELTGVDDHYDFGNWFKNLHPEDEPRVLEANRRALEYGEPYNQVTRVYNPRQRRWRWVQTISNPGYDSVGRLTHFDGMVIDLTEQKEAELALQEVNATLEERVRARTEEIERRRATAESLRDIIRMINSSMPLDEFLQRAVELAAQQLGAGACVLHHLDLEKEVITQAASYGMEGIFEKRGSRPFSAMKSSGGEGYLQALRNRQPVYGNYPPLPERVEEIRRDPTIPEAIKRERVALRERYASSFAVPLYIQDKLYGGMVFYYTEPQDFHDEQIQLGLAFAEQVAVAIENARLLQETEQRRRVAESLRETLSILNTARPLDEILRHIVTQACQLLNAQAAAIHKLDTTAGMLSPQASVGLSEEYATQIRLPPGQGALGQAVLTRLPVAVNDTTKVFQGQTVYTAEGKAVSLDSGLTDRLQRFPDRYGAVLAVPMSVQGEMYGGLVLYYPTPRNIQPDEIELVSMFASQASLAIENALLRAQAAEGAALAERGRLARDLHDAVSQTLFSASLIAEVLPRLWERSPEIAAQKLEELRQLTRGALSEMRTLLLELRPAALDEMDLADLIRHLANAFTARARLPVNLTVEGQADPPANVKAVFYRVAQEALNNIVKHAAASQVSITLQRENNDVLLHVRDDGRGFDPFHVSPASLGLGIMRERAETIGAHLDIRSRPGQGTLVTLRKK
ncbi:MAG: GAF domain-containing protein [Chloroflexi bacterium]|nr:GAF domain-containing protein [Chloroflexota bacterium]